MDNMERATIRPGALSFVLQMARFTGVAPLSFKVIRNGYDITVSRFQLAYCLILTTFFNILGFFEIYFKYIYIKKRTDGDHTGTITILEQIENALCILASIVGYMGFYRMKNMIQHLNILEKIRVKINYDYKTGKHDKNLKWICYFIIILYIVVIVSDNLLSALRASVYDISEIIYAVHYFEYFILLLLKIQIAVLNYEVYKVFLQLNEKLRYLLALAVSDNLSINAKTRVVENEIRSLTQCYISICKAAKNIINADGLYMLLIYICFTVFGVYNGYRMILVLNRPTDLSYRWLDVILRCAWCIIVVVRSSLFVDPFQRISFQVDEMMVLLTKLTVQMTPLGKQVSMELSIMNNQVILNVPEYSPLGIETLNRSLLVTTFSGIITYLVFVVQIELQK